MVTETLAAAEYFTTSYLFAQYYFLLLYVSSFNYVDTVH